MTPPKPTPDQPGTAGVGRSGGQHAPQPPGPRGGERTRDTWSEAVIHVQRLLQLLAYPLVEEDLLAQVVLHHVLEVELAALVEVVHLSLQGEAHHAAAPANAICLVLRHAALVTHALALLHLGKGTWHRQSRGQGQVRAPVSPVRSLTPR